jgi:hypothetical protein
MAISRKAQILATLRAAKAALHERGWQQDGDFANETGQLSLDGALNFAIGGDAERPTVGSGVIEGAVLDVLISRDYDGIVADWNDEPGRSVDDVYALLDEAIARVSD